MEYQLMLEKAVLHYASSAATRMKTMPDKYLQIPGNPDVHVWSLAIQLHEKGFLTASIPNDKREVGVTHISENGTVRLKELRAQKAEFDEAKKKKLDDEIEKNRQARLQKKWWRKIMSGKASA